MTMMSQSRLDRIRAIRGEMATGPSRYDRLRQEVLQTRIGEAASQIDDATVKMFQDDAISRGGVAIDPNELRMTLATRKVLGQSTGSAPMSQGTPEMASTLGAAGRAAVDNVGGTVGGVLGGVGLGALGGSAVGPIGTIVGAVAGGLAGAYGGNEVQNAVEERVLTPEQRMAFENRLAADAQQRPIAAFAGGTLPQLAFARPSVSNLRSAAGIASGASRTPQSLSAAANVIGGAAVGGGVELAQQAATGQYDLGRLAMSTAAGGLLSEPTRLGRAVGIPATPRERFDAGSEMVAPSQAEPAAPVMPSFEPQTFADIAPVITVGADGSATAVVNDPSGFTSLRVGKGSSDIDPQTFVQDWANRTSQSQTVIDAYEPWQMKIKNAGDKLGMQVEFVDGPEGSAAAFTREGGKSVVRVSRGSQAAKINPEYVVAHEWAHSLSPEETATLTTAFGEEAIRKAGEKYAQQAAGLMPDVANRTVADPSVYRAEAIATLVAENAKKSGFWSAIAGESGALASSVDRFRKLMVDTGLSSKATRAVSNALKKATAKPVETATPVQAEPLFSPDVAAKSSLREAGDVAVSGAKNVGQLGKYGYDVLFTPLMSRLEQGGPQSKTVATVMRGAQDDANKYRGRFNRYADEAIAAVAYKRSPLRNAVVEALDEPKLVASGTGSDGKKIEVYRARWKDAAEGKVNIGNKNADKAVKAYQGLIKETGKASEEAGLMIEVDGKRSRFVTSQSAKTMRLMHPDLWNIVQDQTPRGREMLRAVVDGIAAANKSDPDEARHLATALFNTMSESASKEFSTKPVTATIGMEHGRTIENMPDFIVTNIGGKPVQINLLRSAFADNVGRIRDKVADRLALVGRLGSDDIDNQIRSVRKKLEAEDTASAGLFDEVVRSASGIPTSYERPLIEQTRPGHELHNVSRMGGAAIELVKKMGLSLSAAANLPEPVALTRTLAGNRRFIRAISGLMTDRKGTLRALSEIGAITYNPMIVGAENVAANSALANKHVELVVKSIKMISSGIDSLTRLSNEFTETIAAAAGHQMARDLAAGNAVARDRIRLKMLRFSEEQINQLMSGNLPPDHKLFNAVATRFAKESVGSNVKAADMSAASQSKAFNSVFWFSRYPLMITERVGRLAATIVSEAASGDAKRMASAGIIAADFGVGVAAATAGALALRTMISDGTDSVEAEARRIKGQVQDGRVLKLLSTIGMAYVGGPFLTAVDMAGKGKLEQIENLSQPITKAVDIVNFMFGNDRYTNRSFPERVEMLIKSNAAMSRPVMDSLAMIGITHDSRQMRAANKQFYKFLEDQGIKTLAGASQTTEFSAAVRKAREFIDSGDIAKAKEALFEAGKEIGEDGQPRGLEAAKQSLRRMKTLQRIPRDLRDKLVPKLRQQIGERQYELLQSRDRLIDMLSR